MVINHKGESGEVRIAYRSLEQFDDIFSRLTQSRAAPMAEAVGLADAAPESGLSEADEPDPDFDEPAMAYDDETMPALAGVPSDIDCAATAYCLRSRVAAIISADSPVDSAACDVLQHCMLCGLGRVLVACMYSYSG